MWVMDNINLNDIVFLKALRFEDNENKMILN